MSSLDDHSYMQLALALAAEAVEAGEIPCVAVLVYRGEVIARGRARETASWGYVRPTPNWRRYGARAWPGFPAPT